MMQQLDPRDSWLREIFPGAPPNSEMASRVASYDWTATPLGPIASWPSSLLNAVNLCLASQFQIIIFWTRDLIQIYNDAFISITGAKHPSALGRGARETWAEMWEDIAPLYAHVFQTGTATRSDNIHLPVNRSGYLEESFYTMSYTPVFLDSGEVGGVFNVILETTEQVVAERRTRLMRDLAAQTAQAVSVTDVCRSAAATLETSADIRFVLLYLSDRDRRLTLAASGGLAADAPRDLAPSSIEPGAPSPWPIARVLETGHAEVVSDVHTRWGTIATGPWGHPVERAVVLPLARTGQTGSAGVLIAGVTPQRALDDTFTNFLSLVASHIATEIANTRALEEERARAEALAEIDRAKTAFFSNVSHEFRTPLTLMLGPLEDALSAPERALAGASLEVAYRNALRLLKLVNSLLDFARLEAGRVQAMFTPTDLSELTEQLAAVFRSAIERAGLTFTVECQRLSKPFYVDRDMWEKIVLNLLSNAFKFTFEGGVTLRLQETADGAMLTVRDTGIGVAPEELRRLFERFHRVEGARSRTHEGSGIGLALVQELLRLHGGTIRAESTPGAGTTFIVEIPAGSAHLPGERIVEAGRPHARSMTSAAFAEEASRWFVDESSPTPTPTPTAKSAKTVLIVDDNADLREYLVSLLEPYWSVLAAPDGVAALEQLRARRFDLVVSDVMMPRLDGTELLAAIRGDATLKHTPVILLSARAGEEARIEGLAGGADDYLYKPFSARELVARVSSQLALADARLAADRANRAKDEFLAMLGHELRNPLAPIVTALNLLRLKGASAREHDIIARQVSHLIRLVDDLLDISRITRGKIQLDKQVTDLDVIVRLGIETASPLLESRRHALIVDVPQHLTLTGDVDRLTQVVANLLTNAAKYSDPGTAIELRGSGDAECITLAVRDRGQGISADLIATIFEPFVQHAQSPDRAAGGLGLGLAIVKNLVEQHGGTVRATSEGPGRGSEFLVRLPRTARPATRSEPGEPAVLADRSHRVLVVDDNEDAAEALQEVLRLAGHATAVAYDGPSALTAARSFKPTIALLDIGLPAMDGYELAQRLRAEHGDGLRLVALSGYGQESDRARGRDAGFEEHLLKPVDFSTVIEVMRREAPRRD